MKGSKTLYKYCTKSIQGPSNGTTVRKHLRNIHPRKCPELLPKEGEKPTCEFFKPSNMKEVFTDVFMGKLLTWIIKNDQPFSVVDNMYFEDVLDYLRKDISVNSRRTIMRRMGRVACL